MTYPVPQLTTIGRLEIRVVNLARATARRALIGHELAAAGLPDASFAAVDGRDPANRDRLAEIPDSGAWGPMDFHAKGCLLSHLDAMRAFLSGPATHLLMLEDDGFLSRDLGEWLKGPCWPEGADVVKLERWRDDRLRLLVSRKGPRSGGRELRRLWSKHSGTAGYLISKDAAARVVAQRPDGLAIDHTLFNPYISRLARRLVRYQVFPGMVVQGNEPARGEPEAAAAPPPAAPPKKSAALRLTRAVAEVKALRLVPRLFGGQTEFLPIDWQILPPSRAGIAAAQKIQEIKE